MNGWVEARTEGIHQWEEPELETRYTALPESGCHLCGCSDPNCGEHEEKVSQSRDSAPPEEGGGVRHSQGLQQVAPKRVSGPRGLCVWV